MRQLVLGHHGRSPVLELRAAPGHDPGEHEHDAFGLGSGLDAYYTFDSITSGTAADITGKGNTAILGGGVLAKEPVSVASHAPLAHVNIDLIASDGTTLVANIATDVPDDGEFLWAIRESLAPGNYLVRATRTDDTVLSGTSDATFAVTPPVHIYYVYVHAQRRPQLGHGAGR